MDGELLKYSTNSSDETGEEFGRFTPVCYFRENHVYLTSSPDKHIKRNSFIRDVLHTSFLFPSILSYTISCKRKIEKRVGVKRWVKSGMDELEDTVLRST